MGLVYLTPVTLDHQCRESPWQRERQTMPQLGQQVLLFFVTYQTISIIHYSSLACFHITGIVILSTLCSTHCPSPFLPYMHSPILLPLLLPILSPTPPTSLLFSLTTSEEVGICHMTRFGGKWGMGGLDIGYENMYIIKELATFIKHTHIIAFL